MSDVNPIEQCKQWLDEAKQHPAIHDETAMCLATADASGQPSARIILLKGISEKGFAFYTNLGSHKVHDIRQNDKASLCFYWQPLGKQIRIEGNLHTVSEQEADAYFATRSRESRIGAWASHQSQPLASREVLEEAVRLYTAKFEGKDVPRPDFWSGWHLDPQTIEFWKDQPFRLHDRDLYTRTETGWSHSKLYP